MPAGPGPRRATRLVASWTAVQVRAQLNQASARLLDEATVRVAHEVTLEPLRRDRSSASVGFQACGGEQGVLARGRLGKCGGDAQIRLDRPRQIALDQIAFRSQRHRFSALTRLWSERQRGVDALTCLCHVLLPELSARLT